MKMLKRLPAFVFQVLSVKRKIERGFGLCLGNLVSFKRWSRPAMLLTSFNFFR
ncbi:hypothetical protein V6Z12_A05G383300 [Gossypium hirsutum]